MDRIDLQVAINQLKQRGTRQWGRSSPVRQSAVGSSRHPRFKAEPGVRCNAQMQSRHLRQWCQLDDASRNLETAIRKWVCTGKRSHPESSARTIA